MSEKHILCGFDAPDFERQLKLSLKAKGYEPVMYTQLTKKGVSEFLEKNPQCDTVVLQEVISSYKRGYTAEEVACLTDKREVNVIIVLNERHIGSDYVKTLYAAGITGAIFQRGRKGGVSATEVVEQIVQKRSRAEARRYYGIENQKIEPGFLDEESYVGFYKSLHKNNELLKNYLQVCSELSPKQIADFTKRLPEDERAYLAQFTEFHMLMDALKEFGLDLKIKKPRRVRVGMQTKQTIQIAGDTIKIQSQTSQKGPDAYANMTMEELLAAAKMEIESKEPNLEETKEELAKMEAASKLLESIKEAREQEEQRQKETQEKQEQLEQQRKALEQEKKAFAEKKAEEEKLLLKEQKKLKNKQEAVERTAKRLDEKERLLEQEERTDMEEEEIELTTGKQFPRAFLVILFILCALIIGVLIGAPYLRGFIFG